MIPDSKVVPFSTPTCKPGEVYGRLTVLRTGIIEGTYRYVALVQCSCESPPFWARIDALRKPGTPKHPATKSCGCLHRDKITTHGAWGHPMYKVWSLMMRRCYVPITDVYKNYGGRGINVCEEWHDVNRFIEDMYPTYHKGMQIDRTDNSKGYSPDNCRWVTVKEQARNKRNNVLLTVNGETHCLGEWAELTGINYNTLWDRMFVQRLPAEKILSTHKSTLKKSS